jgi:uncharacterized protein YndB with AHSA1/START domain
LSEPSDVRPPWRLNHAAEVDVEASIDAVWAALTEPDRTEAWFLGARAIVGEVGEPYRLERGDGWGVAGRVLQKAPPARLRVTWRGRTPPQVVMPNVEVEFLVEPTGPGRARLVVREYVDGPLPAAFEGASQVGWAMITRSLAAYLS